MHDDTLASSTHPAPSCVCTASDSALPLTGCSLGTALSLLSRSADERAT